MNGTGGITLADQIQELEQVRAARLRSLAWVVGRKGFRQAWFDEGMLRLDAAIATLKQGRGEPAP